MAINCLDFDPTLASSYNSPTQKIRILSENWVSNSLYCPACGNDHLSQYANNSPVADFHCENCAEQFELKSQKHAFGRRIVDGAFQTMIARLIRNDNPNLLLLNYDSRSLSVGNLMIVPKHFFTPHIIESRKPLASSARRAGWVGCNIVLAGIPQSGRIFLVKDRKAQSKAEVLKAWRQTLFLRNQGKLSVRGWLLDVMKCIEDIGAERFTTADVYSFESRLQAIYPGNNNIRAKIRQQLQLLRDRGYLRFEAKGVYALTP